MDSGALSRLLSSKYRDVATAHFTDCLDYGLGMDDMATVAAGRTAPSCADGTDFFESARKDLNSSIADLMQYQPNSNSMQHSYAAIEKFMKAYLCYKFNYLAATLSRRPFGHSLEVLVAEVQNRDPTSPLGTIDLSVISPYEERYEGTTYSRSQLWEASRRAHFAASCVARAMTSRDTRTPVGIPLTFL
jgi:HEPN domain-containing protein